MRCRAMKQHHPCPPENFMLTLLNDNPHHHTQHLISLLVAKVDVIIGYVSFIIHAFGRGYWWVDYVI